VSSADRERSGRRESITDDSVADIRWRLEQAMEKLDGALWYSALALIIEAGEVCQAMINAVQADRRAEVRAATAQGQERPLGGDDDG
jgi:hypothetical protein